MFAGLTPDEQGKRELQDPSSHRVVNGNDQALRYIRGKDMQANFKEVMDCFDIVGFTHEQREDLFRYGDYASLCPAQHSR